MLRIGTVLPALLLATAAFAQEWETLTPSSLPTARHESSFVMGAPGKAYLMGGRGSRPVDIYDVATNSWSAANASTPTELHHFQAVAVDGKIYIPASWTGPYPREDVVQEFYVYDTASDSFSTLTPMPEPRRRGSTAVVHHEGKIYVSHGNIGGHGAHANSLPWLDIYDIETDSWTQGPDAPNFRDHTGGAVISGGQFCVAGGRDGGSDAQFVTPILPVDCYNFTAGSWTAGPDIPTGRAAAAVGATCNGSLIVVGGEGFGSAFAETDLFDGTSWSSGPALNQTRHGTGLAVGDCSCGFIYIAAGGATQGGANELNSTERLTPAGSTDCDPSAAPVDVAGTVTQPPPVNTTEPVSTTTAATSTAVVATTTEEAVSEKPEVTTVATETTTTSVAPSASEATEPQVTPNAETAVTSAPKTDSGPTPKPSSPRKCRGRNSTPTPKPPSSEKCSDGKLAILSAGKYEAGKIVTSGSTFCPDGYPEGWSVECIVKGKPEKLVITASGMKTRTEYVVPYTLAGDRDGIVIAAQGALQDEISITCECDGYAFTTDLKVGCSTR